MNGDNPTSTSLVASCTYQVGTNDNAAGLYNYEYIDNFEFTGFCSSRNPASTGPSQDIVLGYGGTAEIIEANLYFHGWTATTSAGTSNNVVPCTELGGSTQSTALQTIVKLVVDGSDSNAGACNWGTFPMFTHFVDSMIRYTTQGVGQGCHDIHDNIFEYISNPNVPTHGNILECNNDASGSTPNVFYNNTMRHINSNFFSSGQVGWWFCPTTAPEYWFNNLVYDTGGQGDGNLWAYAGPPIYSCSNTGGQYMFNNTLVDAFQPCNGSTYQNGGLYLTVFNEHLINTPFATGGAHDCTGHTDASNIAMTRSASNSQGYTSSSGAINSGYVNCTNESTAPCSPTAANNSTVGAGGNRQSYCTVLAGYSSERAISTDAANACKYDTTDGCSYVTSNHTMNCPAHTPAARPTSTAWDAGAYQFSGSQAQAPQPPTGLQATVQ